MSLGLSVSQISYELPMNARTFGNPFVPCVYAPFVRTKRTPICVANGEILRRMRRWLRRDTGHADVAARHVMACWTSDGSDRSVLGWGSFNDGGRWRASTPAAAFDQNERSRAYVVQIAFGRNESLFERKLARVSRIKKSNLSLCWIEHHLMKRPRMGSTNVFPEPKPGEEHAWSRKREPPGTERANADSTGREVFSDDCPIY
jgi:hypothetical protein